MTLLLKNLCLAIVLHLGLVSLSWCPIVVLVMSLVNIVCYTLVNFM